MILPVRADALRVGLQTVLTRVRDASVPDRSAAVLGEPDAHGAALGWTSGALGHVPRDPAGSARARTEAPVFAELCLSVLLGLVFVAAVLDGGMTPPPF
mgnify:CR=1 FL=1